MIMIIQGISYSSKSSSSSNSSIKSEIEVSSFIGGSGFKIAEVGDGFSMNSDSAI